MRNPWHSFVDGVIQGCGIMLAVTLILWWIKS